MPLPPRTLAIGLLLAGLSIGLPASQAETASPGAPPEGASAVSRPLTRKELERKIKDAESRARRLDREAKDDERRARSWANRASEAEAIGRTELARQNRDISEGFARDAARERQQAQEAREEAARLREQLADLLAGRPVDGTGPGGPGAPGAPPPHVVPMDPAVPGTNAPEDKPESGSPSPGTGGPPGTNLPPGGPVAPGPTPGRPGAAASPRADCPLPAAGATTSVRTTVRSHADNHDHTFCIQFENAVREMYWRPSGERSFVVRLADLPGELNCTTASPGSCAGSCAGRIPRVAGVENVRVTVRLDQVRRYTGEFSGELIFHFPGGDFVVGFDGSGLPQAATAYPLVAAAGVSLILLGLLLSRGRRGPAAAPSPEV
jgi:hypothetical protein